MSYIVNSYYSYYNANMCDENEEVPVDANGQPGRVYDGNQVKIQETSQYTIRKRYKANSQDQTQSMHIDNSEIQPDTRSRARSNPRQAINSMARAFSTQGRTLGHNGLLPPSSLSN
jgi:hypothetical protein